jgi:hypothetical protein
MRVGCWSLSWTLIALATNLLGCPPPGSGGGADAGRSSGAVCVHAGDTCDFAPGKIGVCTEKVEGCQGVASCYVCASLH